MKTFENEEPEIKIHRVKNGFVVMVRQELSIVERNAK